MRKCTKCLIIQDESRFSINKCKKSWYQSHCKWCHNIYMKAFLKKQEYTVSKERKASIRETIINLKDVPCKDCWQKYPWYVMDFDHLPGFEKKFNLSIATSKWYSVKKILEEAKKCDIVCSNCHRVRTFTRH